MVEALVAVGSVVLTIAAAVAAILYLRRNRMR
jgi:hypothetical protein